MSQNPLTEYKVDPELFEVTTEYVKHLNTEKTAKALELPLHKVIDILDKREAKRFIDAIFLEQGYMQRNKLNDVMTGLIEQKLEEMQESGLGSNKDILEIVKLAHQMRMDNAKMNQEEQPGRQTNILNNFGNNYNNLLEKIMGGNEPVSG